MPGTATTTLERKDRTRTVGEALAAFVALTGVVGHIALGLAAITLFWGVITLLL